MRKLFEHLDDKTFTNSRPAIYLVNLLRQPEFKEYIRPTTKILSRAFQYSSSIMEIKNLTVRKWALDQWRKHFLEWVSSKKFPARIEGNIKNVIVTRYRVLSKVKISNTNGDNNEIT
jgi:hypothetical protein